LKSKHDEHCVTSFTCNLESLYTLDQNAHLFKIPATDKERRPSQ